MITIFLHHQLIHQPEIRTYISHKSNNTLRLQLRRVVIIYRDNLENLQMTFYQIIHYLQNPYSNHQQPLNNPLKEIHLVQKTCPPTTYNHHHQLDISHLIDIPSYISSQQCSNRYLQLSNSSIETTNFLLNK